MAAILSHRKTKLLHRVSLVRHERRPMCPDPLVPPDERSNVAGVPRRRWSRHIPGSSAEDGLRVCVSPSLRRWTRLEPGAPVSARSRFAGLALGLAIGLSSPEAIAKVYKCQDATGRIQYADSPCYRARRTAISTGRSATRSKRHDGLVVAGPTPKRTQAGPGHSIRWGNAAHVVVTSTPNCTAADCPELARHWRASVAEPGAAATARPRAASPSAADRRPRASPTTLPVPTTGCRQRPGNGQPPGRTIVELEHPGREHPANGHRPAAARMPASSPEAASSIICAANNWRREAPSARMTAASAIRSSRELASAA